MVIKTGSSANDTLYGGPGGDQLIGLAGDDTYAVYSQFDTVVEQPGEGNDRVLTFASYALASGVSVELLSTAINAGTDPIQLTGNEQNQVIVGNNGANTIDGRGGGDPMIGLGGNDTYYVSGRTDLVIEAPGGGNDIVYARGDFVLNAGSSVETIAVATSARYTGLFIGGNEQAQSIIGSDGADTINSGGGADTLSGGLGDDTYRLFGGETVNEIFGGGYDRVFTSASFVAPPPTALRLTGSWSANNLVSEIEFISTADNAGTDAINIAGSAIAQTIIGNYGNNIINSMGGRDTLIGLRGDDVYRLYGDYEVVIENAGEGNDTVLTDYDYTLIAGASIESLSTSYNNGTLPARLTGNEITQTVVGNYGANTLDGCAGNDTLIGLRGDDVFLFTTALGVDNIDTLPDYGSGADRIRLDPNIFSGLAAGVLSSSAITVGTAAVDADDRIVYDATTGALSFDQDGVGGAAAVQFAILPTGLAASVLSIDVLDRAGPSGQVTIPDFNGNLLVGGAVGPGIDLASTYPNATSFKIGDFTAIGLAPDIIFGPDTSQAPITFRSGVSVGAFDFSQIGVGLRLEPTTDFLTASGRTLIAYPAYTDTGIANQRPTAIIGTPYADYIDASPRPNLGRSDLDPGPKLSGGAGDDTLRGGYLMDGGVGNDILISWNKGVLVGGSGSDTFRIGISARFSGFASAPNVLIDYDPAEDKIELMLFSYIPTLPTPYRAGVLPAAQFTTELKDNYGSIEIIVYNPATGDLSSWDFRSGAGVGLNPIARLPAHLDLTAADFTLIGP